MRNSNGCRTFLLLIPPILLLLPFAALTNLLESISKDRLYDQIGRNTRNGASEITLYGPTSTGSNDLVNTDVTLNIKSGPTFAILGVCIIAYFVSALSGGGIWELKKVQGTGRHDRMWAWLVITSNLIMVGASLGVFGYATSVQAGEGWQSYEDVMKPDQEFTRETWSCQIDQFYPDQDWAGTACGTARATRYLLLAMAVSSLLVLVSLGVLVRARGGFKWVVGGKGRYAGFDNVYEMNPTGPNGPYTPTPIPQWGPHPGQQQWPVQPQYQQQWGPQPIQQWGPQPVQQYGHQPYQQWSPQPIPQVQKSGATTEERAVYH